MLITDTYFVPLVAAIAVLFFIAFYTLLKNKLNPHLLKYGGLALAFLLFFFLKMAGGKLYVIDEDLNVHTYRAVGTFSLPMKGGAVDISGSVRFNRVGIANQSKKTLRIDEVVYGSGYANSTDFQQIESMSIKEVFLERGYISYFFDDDIPDEIEVRGFSSGETKYWLHEYK